MKTYLKPLALAGLLALGTDFANAQLDVDATGKVGIGTATPSKLLHLSVDENQESIAALIENRNTGNSSAVTMRMSANRAGQGGYVDFKASNPYGASNDSKLLIQTQKNGEGMKTAISVDNNQRVMVGGATDSSYAGVNQDDFIVGNASSGSHGMTIVAPRGEYGFLSFCDPGAGGNISQGGHTSPGMIQYNANSRAMNITSNVANGYAIMMDSNNRVGIGRAATNGYQVAMEANNGSVLYLNRKSSAGSIVNFSYNGGPSGCITVNGSSAAFSCSSDKRLKKNIRSLEQGLYLVKKMKAREYTWKSDDRNDIGFIAQELKEIAPNAVVTPEQSGTDYYSVDYGKLTPYLVGAVQELSDKVDSLESENAKLKRQLANNQAQLLKRLAKLEKLALGKSDIKVSQAK